MKRLNPDTGEIFRQGDWRDDGYRFWGYRTELAKKTGYFVETWRSPEKYGEEKKKVAIYATERNKKPDMKYSRNHYSNMRRLSKLKRTPTWLTEEHKQQIKDLYKKAQALQDFTGEPHDVDHIVPLNGEFVSGLHVPWNLRVVTASENRKKNNKYDI